MNVSDLIDQIDAVPSGPDVVAFFDMDGTVLAGFTAFVFAQERMKRPDRANLGVAAVAVRYQAGNATFEELLRASTKALAGMAESDIDDLADRLFTETIAAMIYPEVRRLIRAHQRRGHTVVLLSAATTMQVRPVANTLEVDDVICNSLVVADGTVTGEVVEPIIYGQQKALAAESYAASRKASLDDAFFYTDGYEDLPLLDVVGHPQPLNPGPQTSQSRRRTRLDANRLREPGQAYEDAGRPHDPCPRQRHDGSNGRTAGRGLEPGSTPGHQPDDVHLGRSRRCPGRESISISAARNIFGRTVRRCSCSTTRATSTGCCS